MVARVLFIVTTLLCVGAFALELHTGRYGTLVYVATPLALALIGLLLTTRRPENAVSWVLAGSALAMAVATFVSAYAVAALIRDPGSLPMGTAAAWVENWAWVPGLVLPLCALLLLVPDGHFLSRRWRPAAIAVLVGTLLGSAAVSGSPTFDLGSGVSIDNPLAFGSWIAGAVGVLGLALVMGGLVASLISCRIRYRISSGVERQQLRVIGLSLAVAAVLGIVGVSLWGHIPFGQFLPALAVLAGPAGIAIAVMRYRLYDIDRVDSRTLGYGALTVILGAAYVGLVLAGQTLFSSFAGGSNLAIAVSTLVVAGLFLPVRSRVQGFVDRRFYRSRYDAQRTLEAFGGRLREQVELDALATDLAAVVSETMQPAHTSVWLRSGLSR